MRSLPLLRCAPPGLAPGEFPSPLCCWCPAAAPCLRQRARPERNPLSAEEASRAAGGRQRRQHAGSSGASLELPVVCSVVGTGAPKAVESCREVRSRSCGTQKRASNNASRPFLSSVRINSRTEDSEQQWESPFSPMPCMRHCCLLESQLAGCCTLSACHTIDLRGDLSLSSTCALLPTQELRQAGTLTAGSTAVAPCNDCWISICAPPCSAPTFDRRRLSTGDHAEALQVCVHPR